MKKILVLILILGLILNPVYLWGAIDVGPGATNMSDASDMYENVKITKENPANATGTINHVEVYIATYPGGAKIDWGSCEEVSTDTFTTRGSSGPQLIAGSGLNEFDAPGDFTAFDINTGDYLGIEGEVGSYINVDREGASGDGYWYDFGATIPCTEQGFTFYSPRDLAIYATGTESGGPPAVGVQSQILILE